uniref:Putative secreted protein n=1 Tax=Anopheles darlingi TaxID=43151 RepID=A0A2M4DPR9_ANODA
MKMIGYLAMDDAMVLLLHFALAGLCDDGPKWIRQYPSVHPLAVLITFRWIPFHLCCRSFPSLEVWCHQSPQKLALDCQASESHLY